MRHKIDKYVFNIVNTMYHIWRNKRTCLNKRTPLPMRKVNFVIFFENLTLGSGLGLTLTPTLWLDFYFF